MESQYLGYAALISSLATGLAIIIAAVKASNKLEKTTELTAEYHKENKATTEQIHTLVNSNMARMFQALAGACVAIIILIWFGINEVRKSKK